MKKSYGCLAIRWPQAFYSQAAFDKGRRVLEYTVVVADVRDASGRRRGPSQLTDRFPLPARTEVVIWLSKPRKEWDGGASKN